MAYSGARETLIYEKKNPKSKISCQTPFKQIIPFDIARDRCEDW